MSDLRIDIADLLRRPGSRRRLQREVVVSDLRVAAAAVEEPVVLDLVLERVHEGVVARGLIRARWTGECGVCLRGLGADLRVPVSELFEQHPVDGETYLLAGHEIDLEQLVRDAVLLELPLAPSCASTGGSSCRVAPLPSVEGDDTALDPRWAVLSELEL